MLPSLREELRRELQQLRDQARLRVCPAFAGPSRVLPIGPEGELLSFASNDYLGLATHPALLAAAVEATHASGLGASASRLVTGDLPDHRAVEDRLSQMVDLPGVLLFPTGYQANQGLLTALARPGDLIVSDAANHASIIDGCRLSRADIAIFPHRNASAAAALLVRGAGARRRLIVTESLFSMDGDVAPLSALAEIAHRADAVLIVDEAHALGVLGPAGAGLCRAAGIVPDALVGTLGKAFGASGGFVAGTSDLRDYLVNRARTFIFTTALPPPIAAAARAAINLATSAEGDARRVVLRQRIDQLCTALHRPATEGPIVPIVLGSDSAALSASHALRKLGLFVQAIRPPTVPEGTARLRVTLSSAHTAAMVDRLAAGLAALALSR